MRNLLSLAIAVFGVLVAASPAYSQSALPRAHWVVTASTTSSGEAASRAIDGAATTRYSTGTGQTAGQWFSIDMITAQTFSQITIDPTGSANDWTRGYQVFVSNDALTWGAPVASGTGSAGVLTIIFPTQTARFVGIVQTGSASNWWSIGEINVYGPGATPTVALATMGWVATASATSGSDVPGHAIDGALGTRWTTGVPQASGQFFQLDMAQPQMVAGLMMSSDGSTSDYARAFQIFVSNDPSNWGAPVAAGTGSASPVTVAFPAATGRYLKIVQTASASSWWSIAELTVLGVGTFAPTARVLPRTGWIATASASCSSDTPANALDDDLSTRFSTCQNQASGQSFQVDMLTSRAFTKITFDAGSNAGDQPRGYAVFASQDGASWGGAIASGAGTAPLVTLNFPYQNARYLKVVLTSSVSTNWWSIAELNVYGIAPYVLMRDGWVASASVNGGAAISGVDGKLSTRWTTNVPQANGQWYQLDMLAPQSFDQITLDADGATSDYPRGLAVYVSNDPSHFGSAVATGTGSAPLVSIGFPPRTARYVRVVETGAATNWWSIAEVNVLASAVPSYGIPRVDTTAAPCADGTQPIGCRAFDCTSGVDTGQWQAQPACTGAYPTCASVCPDQGTELSPGALTPSGSLVQCACTCGDDAGASLTIPARGCAAAGVTSPCQSICAAVVDPCAGAAGCSITQCTGGQTSSTVSTNSCDPTAPASAPTSALADWQAAVDPTTSEVLISIGALKTHVPLSGTLSFDSTAGAFALKTADVHGGHFSFFGRQVASPRVVLLAGAQLTTASALDEAGTTGFQTNAGALDAAFTAVVDGQPRTIVASNTDPIAGTFSPTGGLTLTMHSAPSLGTSIDLTLKAALTHRPPFAAIAPIPQVVECTSKGTAPFHLDGSASASDGGSITHYQWSEETLSSSRDRAPRPLASTATIDTSLVLGPHVITLNVYDDRGATGSATLNISVVDSVAPTIQSPGDVSKLAVVGPTAQVDLGWPVTTDACDPTPTVHATLIQSGGSPANQAISDPAHALLPLGLSIVRWLVRDAAGNTRTVDQTVSLSADDVGVVHSALGAAPVCPQPALLGSTATHVEIRACVIGAHDQSTSPPTNVGTDVWASCANGDDACVTANLNALLAPANQIWSGTVQFDLVGFKVLRDRDRPTPGVVRPVDCEKTGEAYGDVCVVAGICSDAGPEVNQEVVDCQNAWGLPKGSSTRDQCDRGLVVLVTRRFLDIGLEGVSASGNLCDQACLDPTTAVNTQGAFSVIDGQAAAQDSTVVAHELGHALGLKHGDGLDDDCDGQWDEICDLFYGHGKESMIDQEAGLSLMSPSGSSTVLTNLQKNKARDFALTTAPNGGLSGANCPTVIVTDPSIETIGTPASQQPPAPNAGGCGCAVTRGGESMAGAAIGAGLLLAAARRRRVGRRLPPRTRDGV